MAGVLTSTLTSHLVEVFPQVKESVVARNAQLYNLFPKLSAQGGDAYTWRINSTGNTSASSFAEGDSEPVAVAQANTKASLGWKAHWVVLRISRMAVEDAGGNAYLLGDLVSDEVTTSTEDLLNDMETAIRSDGTGNGSADITGIQAAIHATNTYAGINKTTSTWFGSSVTAVGGALAESHIQAEIATQNAGTRRGNLRVGLCNGTVWNIVGNLGDANYRPMFMQGDNPATITSASGFTSVWASGIEFLRVPDYTAQRIDLIDPADFHIRVIRDFQVDPWERHNDDITTIVSWRGNLVCRRPYAQSGLTGITS